MQTIYFERNIPKILLMQTLRPIWPNVVYSRFSPTRLHDLDPSPLPGPRGVRVRNRLSGICASDLHLLFGEASLRMSLTALPGAPRLYMGHELVGEVVEVGPEVESLAVGDRVILDAEGANCHTLGIEPLCRHCAAGNWSLCENAAREAGADVERCVGGGWGEGLTAHETALYRVPETLDDEQAMMVEPLSVGVRTALRRLPGSGEQVLVIGCGTIGLAVVQALRALSPDCRIAAMVRYPHQAKWARRLGASEVIGPDDDPYAAVARTTGAQLYSGPLNNRTLLGGFDVIYDCVGSQRTLGDALRWARAGGTVVLAGVRLAPLRVDLTPVWHQEVDLIGVFAHGREQWNGRRWSTYGLTIDLLQQGKLVTEGLVTHRFPLDRWREAVRTAADKRSGSIKVTLALS